MTQIPAEDIRHGDRIKVPVMVDGTVTHVSRHTPAGTVHLTVATRDGDLQMTVPAARGIEVEPT